jgi:hypothetical protein
MIFIYRDINHYVIYICIRLEWGASKNRSGISPKNGILIDKIPTHQITVHQLEPTGEPTLITSASYFIEQVEQVIEQI